MRKKKKKNKEIIELLKKLPAGRKIYYKAGSIMVEVSKEEAIKLLEKEKEGED
ncbi:prefoldin subunit [Desulfurobacterium indicum]|uniref:prefoldin subunit n=1 Tax=Desulfurobacterium indicum TaxID=1914305 RepID=UPI000977347E|nr:prefoldin subunit [Desulfurobacterium indicum]